MRRRRSSVSSASWSREISVSPSHTSPLVTVSSPAITCIRVDLPDPLGPMIAVKRPASIPSVAPSRALTSAPPPPYDFVASTTRATRAPVEATVGATVVNVSLVTFSMLPTLRKRRTGRILPRGYPASVRRMISIRFRWSLDSGETVLEGVDDHLNPVPEPEFAEDPADVRLHGGFAEELRRRDLRVAETARRQNEDLPFARSQVVELGRTLLHRLALREVLEELAGRAGGDHRASRVHRTNGREQELRFCVLQDETARSPANGTRSGLIEIERGEHHDAGCPSALTLSGLHDLRRRCDPVHHRHADVHEHDIGSDIPGELHPLGAVGRLAHELEIRLGAHEHADSG